MLKNKYLRIAGAAIICAVWVWASIVVPRSFALAILGDASALLVLAMATAALARNAARSRHRIRLFWTLMAVGFSMWTLNQAAWCAYEIVLRSKLPDPFFGDIILFMHIVPLIAAVALASDNSESQGLTFSSLNFLMLLVWWVFLYAFIVFPDEYIWLRVPVYTRNFDWLYLTENLVWVLALALAARGARGRWKQLYLNLFGASALYAIASEALNAAISRGTYFSGSWYDIPFLAALCWFLWTAVEAGKWTLEGDATSPGKNRWLMMVAPRLAMIAILSLPAMGLWVLRFDDSPAPLRRYRIVVMLAAMIILGFFLFLKQYLLDRQLVHVLEESDRGFVNLQRLQTELVRKEKLAALGQLVAGAAQEINQPLTAILHDSDQFSKDPSLGKDQLALAQKIGHHARRTRELIADLLSFAQQNPAAKSPVDLGAVVQRAVHMEGLRLEANRIRVETHIAPDLPRIMGNQNQLFESCLQIMSNSMDALEEVGGGRLVISVYVKNGEVVVEFSDTGPGIQEPGRVFDPFYTTKPVGKGTGLGLSAVYGVVQDHQGQITCMNRPEGGAQFVLRFPTAESVSATVKMG